MYGKERLLTELEIACKRCSEVGLTSFCQMKPNCIYKPSTVTRCVFTNWQIHKAYLAICELSSDDVLRSF